MLLLGLTLILLLLGGLAIDIAHAFCVKRQLQAAADAGAMAGAYCLTSPFPSLKAKKQAQEWAREVISRNHSDGINLIHDEDNVNVTVDIDVTPLRYPYLCHVAISKNMATTLGRLVGVTTVSVGAEASGGVYQGVKRIYPGQLVPMGISSRAGLGNTKLNLSPAAGKYQNAQWLSDWHGTSNPPIDVGATGTTAQETPGDTLAMMTPGTTLIAPMVKSAEVTDTTGEKALPKNNQVIGTLGFKVKRVVGPNSIEGEIISGSLISGKPGMPILPTTNQTDTTYSFMNPCWRVLLLH